MAASDEPDGDSRESETESPQATSTAATKSTAAPAVTTAPAAPENAAPVTTDVAPSVAIAKTLDEPAAAQTKPAETAPSGPADVTTSSESSKPTPTEPTSPDHLQIQLQKTQTSANHDDNSPTKKLEKPLEERRAAGAGQIDTTVEGAQKSPNAPVTGTGGTDFDDFGLPIRKAGAIQYSAEEVEEEKKQKQKQRTWSFRKRSTSRSDADHSRASSRASNSSRRRSSLRIGVDGPPAVDGATKGKGAEATEDIEEEPRTPMPAKTRTNTDDPSIAPKDQPKKDFAAVHAREASNATDVSLSEFSHQKLTTEKEEKKADEDGGWQTMPAFAPYDMYDDDDRLIAKEHVETEEDSYGYAGLGGAGKGYTRVLIDDDAESATSMDDNTNYLFKTGAGTSMMDDEEEQRDAVSQMQATKDLLTEGQRIAYVGITRLHLYNMLKEMEAFKPSRRRRKEMSIAAESLKMWSQKMMIRLYAHMDISLAEQVMIEQLSEHGVQPKDLTPALMANSRVKNPMADENSPKSTRGSTSASTEAPNSPTVPGTPSATSPRVTEVTDDDDEEASKHTSKAKEAAREHEEELEDDEEVAEPPPPYQEVDGEELPDVRTPSQMPSTDKIDIDLRWTVLCDLFLVLIADSVYDARSRVLLERVGESLDVPWIDICKFERKVTEALEMQQQAEKENWDEADHMELRRKLALKRRYVMMGLATVGGGLVIGLSAGLLAPVIGAGLAAGFTTIGVTGTSSFLAGAGGAAIITSSAAASGSVIGVRAANRRTGAVKTFEYRPLHNNKRVNLIVTVSGWMTGKVDDVRLPYSTVDPVMGDIYSVLWEPEMLTSMGDTINILATEALTQGLQQILGSTILISLMAALQLPVVLTKLSYLIDNPWAVSLDRATAAGLILADSLIDRSLGTRPITLVGYSLGSRVIFSCLQELARKGAYGLVQNAFIFGSPVVVKQDEFLRARSVVAGRLVNGYNRSDWILGYLFRLTNGGIRRVAGLGSIEDVPGIENMDVTEFVVGHMDYRTAMPRLLRECGWLVESDEFTEIEDPDPENHGERQRELINEIEEARKELEKETARQASGSKKGGAFSFFSRKKKGEKQEWEIYEDLAKKQQKLQEAINNSNAAKAASASQGKTEDGEGNNHGILFDVDAIRAELAKERENERNGDGGEQGGPQSQPADDIEKHLQVRELKSTLPPMKLTISPSAAIAPPRPSHSPRPSLSSGGVVGSRRVTDTAVAYRVSQEVRASTDDRVPTLPKQMTFPILEDRPYSPHGAHSPALRSSTTTPTIVDNEGVSMTFDYGLDEGHGDYSASTQPPPPPPKDHRYSSGAALAGATMGAGAVAGVAAAVSPPVPAIRLTDPWNEVGDDDDDDDFGKEEEISMTFA
ncbi:transmembrane and coiled-coil domain-containing protein [Ophiostoma piceae UAMH 11346]|uniref:Transmembrane and coiled-coil domain-containing protein n=1 Tax=Ophiostoma piceae (strain UAMH 11346) TaxID=1262450 RepID=S3CQQ5_OPHP1|nr:transmembrane and coiled-coil domain-containing protein [Ophiostoma piceae UAMH 11346]